MAAGYASASSRFGDRTLFRIGSMPVENLRGLSTEDVRVGRKEQIPDEAWRLGLMGLNSVV